MTSKRGGSVVRLNKIQGRGGGAKKTKGKAQNIVGGSNINQSGGFLTSVAKTPIPLGEKRGRSKSPKPRNNVSSEELEKRTARANRFRDTLDPSQLLSVGSAVPHGRNLTVKIEEPPINPIDDFFEELSIYHQTQMMIKQVNDSLPPIMKKLAWDFFHEETLPITLNSLYEKDEAVKNKSFTEIEDENVKVKVNKLTIKPKVLDLPSTSNFFDVEMEDVVQYIATSPVTPGATFRYVEMDVDETFPPSYIPFAQTTPSSSNSSTIIQLNQLNLGQSILQRLGTCSSDVTRKNSLERINTIIPATEKSHSMLSTMEIEYDNHSNQDESIVEPKNTFVESPTEGEFNQVEVFTIGTVDETDITNDTDPPIVGKQEDEQESSDLPTPKLDLYSLVHGPPPLTQAQQLKEDKIKQRQALYKKTKALPDRLKSEKKRRKIGYDTLINKNRNVKCVLARVDDLKAEATRKAQEKNEKRKKAIEAQSSVDEDYESVKKELRRRSQILERITNENFERAKKDRKYRYSMTKIEEEALIEIDNTPSLLRS